jgi:hypothetical protein
MKIPDIEHLRRLIESTLAELGMPDAYWSCVKDTSSIETHRTGVLVVWLSGQAVVEFYSEDGSLLKTVSVRKEKTEREKAA